MAITVSQTTATAAAATLKGWIAQLASLRNQAKAIAIEQNSNDYVSTWQAMTTAPYNADGTVNTTSPDGSSVSTHPIIQPTGAPLNVTSTNLVNAQGVLTALIAFLDGTSAPAQLNRNSTVDAING